MEAEKEVIKVGEESRWKVTMSLGRCQYGWWAEGCLDRYIPVTHGNACKSGVEEKCLGGIVGLRFG